jgi:transposase
MAAPRKFGLEMRDRAVRMYRDRLEQQQESKVEARRQVRALLDIKAATIRNWVEDAERRDGSRAPAARGVESEEVRALKRENAELRRANETSHAPGRSSRGWAWSGKCEGFVVVGAGVQAVVQAAEEPVEQVPLRGGVSVTGGAASVVVLACAG